MGEHETADSLLPSGLLPSGLLPNEAASVMRVLDSARWSKAEERTAELIQCIKPNEASENQRNAVASYVQRLIMKCFPCQVFTFGSVPLKTYLPDGDIDLTAFSKNQDLKDTWAHQVRDMLENEEKNENAEFQVKEVQYIQAEVKIIKCLVENIVVDISFNQLGGLCTLCFLEEVDHMIKGDHLFKRSIILIKAWCYYESRILGAHHGLISTYALETLVLYIFHVFNKSFAGPLEVLYRFLEFFSKFDWDNFCVSLWGPVPIGSLPNVTAEPPRKDSGKLLLAKSFLDACGSVYAVFPNGQESNSQSFISKHFNVIDPLRVNNNLGRSVSKGNFFRIRSAFAFGAKKLARLLDCDSENIHFEVNQFFQNTWERHGSGHRPDAPLNGFWQLRPLNHDYLLGSENENFRNIMSAKSGSREGENDALHGPCIVPFQHGNHVLESTSWSSDAGTVSQTQSQKINVNYSLISDQARREISTTQSVHSSSKPDSLASDSQGRYLFARTRSSPELTDTCNEVSSQARRNKVPETAKGQTTTAWFENINGQNTEHENLSRHTVRSLGDDLSSLRHDLLNKSPYAAESNSFLEDSATGEEFTSVLSTQGMHLEEQDLVNMMTSSSSLGFNGQVHLPLNLASSHVPFPIPPSALASMGYLPRNLGGMLRTNIPLMEPPWDANTQFPQGLISSQLTHYFPAIGLTSSPECSVEHSNENFGTVGSNPGEADNDFWREHERVSVGGLELDNENFEIETSDDKQQSTSGRYNCGPSSRIGGSGNSSGVQQKFTRESLHSNRVDHAENFPHAENKGDDVFFHGRLTISSPFPTVPSYSIRSRASSESSWDGSSAKMKSAREKRGRKISTAVASVVHVKGKGIYESSSSQVDGDRKECSSQLSFSPEIVERGLGPTPTAVSSHPVPGFELAQTSGSDPVVPIPPMLLGHGARFYPTGPPVPFVTMLPIYNFPAAEMGTSEASTSQFGSEKGMDNMDPCQNGDLLEGHHDLSEVPSPSSTSVKVSASVEAFELKSDILNSDFASHWQNLQYGRFCQYSRLPTPVACPSPVVVPPVYVQGRIPWDGPGRPVSPNMNLLSQAMGYGHRILPVAPLQAVSNRPAGFYQHYVDEVPRYRGGTGTYLPDPKVSVRDRHSTNSSRKANYYNYDRSEHHGDYREGSWNNSKSRAPGRSHSRNQADKSSSSRLDRLAGTSGSSRLERTWVSHRHDNPTSHQQSQNGPARANIQQIGSPNIAYGMYPITSMNPGGLPSNGPVVMFYPYDHQNGGGGGYVSADQIEFGSLGNVGFAELSNLNEDQRFHSSPAAQLSSPDQPSSPHHLQR
ncbi:unnamed protein product [Linum trigynum]|uniref:Polymerase nucleotidyl transferase domain-containing protein n=1 Tax=Linum trigynum TaxID=586398 RepID=A0AAV2E157_9ROSI